MVKIHNVFGDTWIGKYHDKIYQRVHGQQVRREGFKRPDPQGPIQEQQKQRFKEFVEWWRSQTTSQKDTLKGKFAEKGVEKENPQYITVYHYLLGMGLTPPRIEIIDPDKLTYKVTHPSIHRIEEIDFNGNIIATYDNLSNVYELEFTGSQQLTPNEHTRSVRVYTPFGQSTDFIIRMVEPTTCIPYELIAGLTFPTPTESFTVQNLQAYEQLYFLFSFDLHSSTSSSNSIIMYPNSDTGANYTSVRLYVTDVGHSSYVNSPSPNMHLCRVGWSTRSLNEGYAYLHTKVTGYWRALHTYFTIDLYDHAHYGYEKQVGLWKNTEDPINNIQFKVRQLGYPFTGWIKVYGLKEAV